MGKKTAQNHPTEFLESLKHGAPEAFETLYREVWPQVVDHVLKNTGTVEEAKDIFQESLIVLIRYLKRPDFKLTAQINTFIVSIAQKMWLKQLRRKKSSSTHQLPDNPEAPDTEPVLWDADDLDKRCFLVSSLMLKIGAECRTLLTEYYFTKTPLKKIGEMLGYTEGFIRVKKTRCLSQLRKLLTGHPDFIQH